MILRFGGRIETLSLACGKKKRERDCSLTRILTTNTEEHNMEEELELLPSLLAGLFFVFVFVLFFSEFLICLSFPFFFFPFFQRQRGC